VFVLIITLDMFVCLYLLLLSRNILPEARSAIESDPTTVGANRRVAFSSKVILLFHKHRLFYCKMYVQSSQPSISYMHESK
jgi:hypothetical protein